MQYTYLTQSETGLILTLSNEEMPKKEELLSARKDYYEALEKWHKQSKSVPVDKIGNSEQNFRSLAYGILKVRTPEFLEALKGAILLPQGCYEIKDMCDNCLEFNGCISKETCTNPARAYFVNPKKEEANEAGLKKLADLLEKHGLRKYLNINGFGHSQIERDIVDLLNPSFKKEEAVNEAVEFAEFVNDLGYTQVKNGIWRNRENIERTTKELYEIFKQKQ